MKPTLRLLALAALACALTAGAARAADHREAAILLDPGLAGQAVIVQVPPLSSRQVLLWSGAPLVQPTDAILEPDGTLLIVDPGAGRIFEFDPSAASAPVPVASPENFPCWIDRLSDTRLLLSGPGGLAIHDQETGAHTPLPTAVVDPFDVEVTEDGRIFVADPGAGQLLSVSRTTFEGTPLADSDSCWLGTGIDDQIVLSGPGGVFLVDSEGGTPEPLSTGGLLQDPTAVAVGSRGELLVADRGAAAVIEIDPQTGAQTLITQGQFLAGPEALVMLSQQAVPAIPGPGPALLAAFLLGALAWAIARTARSRRARASASGRPGPPGARSP